MPYRDGTGPEGKGAMTGRGMGECSNRETDTPFARKFLGNRSFGRGCGRRNGMGRRRFFQGGEN